MTTSIPFPTTADRPAVTLETELVRATDVFLRLDGAGTVYAYVGGRGRQFGHDALAWLDAFARPRRVGDALRDLAPRLAGRQAAHDALRAVAELVNADLLCSPDDVSLSRWPSPASRYDSLLPQRMMLDDPIRKPAFVEALRRSIRPDDVVLDLGSASGLLSIVAAQAGARRVFAVEPAAAGAIGGLLAEANDVADRIEVLRGWSTQLTLPERASVLVVDLVGNEALDMSLLEIVRDARERLLLPDARIIPAAVDTYAQLVEIPDEVVDRQRIDDTHVARWRTRYGVDFSPLRDVAGRTALGFYERPEVVGSWPVASEPVPVYGLDLADPPDQLIAEFGLQPRAGTDANGLLLFSRVRLADDVVLDLHPSGGSVDSHWYSSAWLLGPVGDGPVQCRFEYLGDGHAAVQRIGGAT